MERRKRVIVIMLLLLWRLAMELMLNFLRSTQAQLRNRSALMSYVQSLEGFVATRASKRKRIVGEWWVKPRSLTWFDKFAMGIIEEGSVRRMFKMGRSTLEWLCNELGPLVQRDETNFRCSIPPMKRIALGIYRLACGSSISEASETFAVGEATVLVISRELFAALRHRFGNLLCFPDGEALKHVIEGFEAVAGLPNCCGAIDCMQFNIKRPPGFDGVDYLDRNRNFSIAAQVVVDASTRIVSISVGYPGSIQDSRILKMSGLFEKVRVGALLGGPTLRLEDPMMTEVEIPQYFVGGASYPSLPWLVTPYDGTPLPLWKMHFNKSHMLTRLAVDKTLLHLKKWGILGKQMQVDVKTAVGMIYSCAILHNLLLERGEGEIDDEIDGATFETDTLNSQLREERDKVALQVRDALAMHLVKINQEYTEG